MRVFTLKGRLYLLFETLPLFELQFVPKTHLVFSGSKDKTIKCWDADTFEHIMTLEVT